MSIRQMLSHALVLSLVCTVFAPRASATSKRTDAPWPRADAVQDKDDVWVVEFVGRAPKQLPGGAALTPVTERIALSRVDPRSLPNGRANGRANARVLGLDPHPIRRVERNLKFFIAGKALPPHALRDLRSTQAVPWHKVSGRRGALFAQPGPMRRARVGIIDTGIDYTHPDLLGNVGGGVNFLAREAIAQTPGKLYTPFGDERADTSEMDYNGHGTHVAGIIGARHNDFGIDGVATAVELVGLKVFGRLGTGYLSDILQAVAWATRENLDILNMSFGTYEHSPILEDALARAHAAGLVLVAAAGNDSVAMATFPASLPFVMSVGATGPRGISRTSNHGPDVSVFAPGHEVMSTTSCMLGPQVYSAMSGTSAAAAQVTGVLAQTMLSGMSATSARAYVENRLVTQPHTDGERDAQADTSDAKDAAIRVLYAPGVLADLQARPHAALSLTDLTAHQTDTQSLSVTLRLQNIGNRDTEADKVGLRLWQGQQEQTFSAGDLPALAPGASHTLTLPLPLPADWVTELDTSVGIEAMLQHQSLQDVAPVSTAVAATPKARVQVGAIWMDPHNAPAKRMMRVKLRNVGNAPAHRLAMRGFGIPATHEGIWSVPHITLTQATALPALAPQEQVTVALPVRDTPGLLDQSDAWTWLVEITQDGRQLERAIQSWETQPTGQAQLYYNQRAHMAMVETAVEMLRLQNVHIPDLHTPQSPYLGSVETSRDWGSAVSIGMSNSRWNWSTDWPAYPQSARTLIDGASACDGIDVAYGDTGIATWDTHYWLVGEGDNVGLGNVSALQKVYALVLGGHGSEIKDGALQAYRQGDKARAWWMMGHAAHLIGDLSTGAHTINRNWHGVIGDPYHDWMGKNYHAWPATVPLMVGGYVDPYRSDLPTNSQRLRFLTYTVARIGASFPWHQTRGWIPVQHARSGDGSRELLGDGPHYDEYLREFFAAYPDHPHTTRDISKEEALTVWNTCIAVDELEDMQFLADCWDGGDGHIDRNNTRYDDLDGDLSRIADRAYTYGVRAIAGLLVMFARETGQI